MKKVIITFIFIFLCVFSILSQTLKIENGVAISSLRAKNLDFFSKNLYSYCGIIGIDYFEHRYFYFSSEIGYFKKGGRDKVFITEGYEIISEKMIFEKWDFIHVNSTFRLKYPFNINHFYIGIGPSIDFLIGTNRFITKGEGGESIEINKVHLGVCPEIGFNYNLTGRLMIGANISYITNLTPFIQKSEIDIEIRNNTISAVLSLGYKLN